MPTATAPATSSARSTLDDGFVPVENKSDCPTVSDRLPLRASEVKSCTMVARGTREDYGFSNIDPLDVGVRATLYMLGSNWTAVIRKFVSGHPPFRQRRRAEVSGEGTGAHR